MAGDELAEGVDAALDGFHHGLGQPEQGHEQQTHDPGEDEQAPNLVAEDDVDALGEILSGPGVGQGLEFRGRPRSVGDHAADDRFDPLIMRFDVRLHGVDAQLLQAIGSGMEKRGYGFLGNDGADVGGVIANEQALGDSAASVHGTGRIFFAAEDCQAPADQDKLFSHGVGERPLRHWRDDCAIHGGLQFGNAFTLGPHDGNHRNAQFPLEFLGRYVYVATLGDVHHVQRDNQRAAQLYELADQVQIALQIAGIDDNDDDVRAFHIRPNSAEDFHRDLFIGGAADEAVGAGQIDDVAPAAIGQLAAADFFFDGYAGIVGDFLAQAGEGVEDGCLAAVGITGQRNDQCVGG